MYYKCSIVQILLLLLSFFFGGGGEDVYFIVGVQVQVPAVYFTLKFAWKRRVKQLSMAAAVQVI